MSSIDRQKDPPIPSEPAAETVASGLQTTSEQTGQGATDINTTALQQPAGALDFLLTSFEGYVRLFQSAETENETDKVALNMFLSLPRQLFATYSGSSLSTARDILLRAMALITRNRPFLISFFRSQDRRAELNEHARSILSRLISFARDFLGHFPSPSEIDSLYCQWQCDINAGLQHLNSMLDRSSYYGIGHVADSAVSIGPVIESAEKCLDVAYMEKFVAVIKRLCWRCIQPNIPFVFLCAPSGSGKSVFGTNLGKCSLPSLHWMQSASQSEQPNYIPFRHFSVIMNGAFERDFTRYVEERCNNQHKEELFSVDSIDTQSSTFAFESVHILVHLYENLFQIKAQNASISWLQAQFKLNDLKNGKMTCADGANRLYALVESGKNTSHYGPLLAFIDECSLANSGRAENPPDWQRLLYFFTRSLLRVLRIVPILAGTDAKISTFCHRTFNFTHSRGAEILWAVAYNDCPEYMYTRFSQKYDAISARFAESPAYQVIIRILDFLKSVRAHENPLLMEMCLEYLHNLPHNVSTTFNDLLDALLMHVSRRFIVCKGRVPLFNIGQQAYIMSHLWRDGTLYVSSTEDVCINGHLAHLVGTPDQPEESYFTLKVVDNRQKYLRDDVIWKPESFYTSFHLASLTGLILFGLDLCKPHHIGPTTVYHLPFVCDSGSYGRMTALDGVTADYNTLPILPSNRAIRHSSTDTAAELLYHMASVIASRGNGVSGCTLSEYFGNFVRELDSNYAMGTPPPGRDSHNLPAGSEYWPFSHDLPKVTFEGTTDLDHIIVPVLAPMAVPEWPKSVVDLLAGLGNDNPLHLGVFEPSFGDQSRVSSIIYETNLQIAQPTNSDEPPTKLPRTSTSEGLVESKARGYPGQSVPLARAFERKICIVGDCNVNKVTLGGLWTDIVESKFEKYKNCKTFVVLADSCGDFSEKQVRSKKTLEYLKKLNQTNYYVWYLKKSHATNRQFVMTPVPHQDAHHPGFKDIFLIGLTDTCHSRATIDKLKEKKIKEDALKKTPN